MNRLFPERCTQLRRGNTIEINKIMVPTDFSDTALRAVNHGALLARAFGAKLILANVLETGAFWQFALPGPTMVVPVNIEEIRKSIESHAEYRLIEIMESDYARKAPSIKTAVIKEHPASVGIAKYAKSKEIDLIVIGTHGRTGISEWLFGSTTEKLLRIAPCPVLTIGPAAAQEPEREVFNHVLFPFDFSPASRHALHYACAFARTHEGKLTLLHVIELRKVPKSYPVDEAVLSASSETLQRRIQDEMRLEVTNMFAGECPGNVEFVVRDGKPYKEIVEYAGAEKANLVVIGNTGINETHGHKLGSTAENVVPRAKCPVLVVNTRIHEFLQ